MRLWTENICTAQISALLSQRADNYQLIGDNSRCRFGKILQLIQRSYGSLGNSNILTDFKHLSDSGPNWSLSGYMVPLYISIKSLAYSVLLILRNNTL